MPRPPREQPQASQDVAHSLLHRRTLVRGLGGIAIAGAGAGLLAVPRATAAENLAPLHGADLQMNWASGGTGKILHTYKDTTAGIAPSFFGLAVQLDGTARLVVGCTGLTNQVQTFDPSSGKVLASANQVTTAQQGVQEVAFLPRTNAILTVSSAGLHIVSSDMSSSYVGRLSEGSTSGYDPRPDSSGNVWLGTYGQNGKGTFAKVDPVSKTITMMPPIAPDTDYVRCVSVAGNMVWGGTGSIKQRLISMSMDEPGVYRTYSLPGAAETGNVQWLQAYHDYVIVGYKMTSGASITMVLNLASGSFTQLAYPVQANFVARDGDELIYFDARFLKKYNLVTDVASVIMEYQTFRPLSGTMISDSGRLKMVIAASRASDETYRCIQIDVLDAKILSDAPLDILPSAFKVQTIYSAADKYLYAGGYQGDSISRIDPDTGAVRRSAKSDPIDQIESMYSVDSKVLYVGSYPGGDIVKYYSPTSQSKLIASLNATQHQQRPFGMAKAAGRMIVGFAPSQGYSGGALAVVNPVTEKVERHVTSLVGDHSIVGLWAFRDVVYGTSSRMAGYGAPTAPGWAQVFAYDVRQRTVLWNTTLKSEGEINSPIRLGTYIYVSVANGIVRLRASDGRAMGTFRIYSTRKASGYRTTRIAWHARSGCIIHAGGGRLTAIHIKSSTTWVLANGGYAYPAVGASGRLFAIHNGRDIREIRVMVPAV